MLLFMISFMHRKCTGRVISSKTPSMCVKFLEAIRLRSTAQVFLAFLAFALYNASAFRICTPIFLFFPNKPMPIVVLSHFFCWHRFSPWHLLHWMGVPFGVVLTFAIGPFLTWGDIRQLSSTMENENILVPFWDKYLVECYILYMN